MSSPTKLKLFGPSGSGLKDDLLPSCVAECIQITPGYFAGYVREPFPPIFDADAYIVIPLLRHSVTSRPKSSGHSAVSKPREIEITCTFHVDLAWRSAYKNLVLVIITFDWKCLPLPLYLYYQVPHNQLLLPRKCHSFL